METGKRLRGIALMDHLGDVRAGASRETLESMARTIVELIF
jgi:hypothetical protein